MNEKREDRRVSRTRRLLRDALMGLILERGYDAVTVEEIAQRADLGRTTFYLHYRDKEDLLLESIDAIIDDLIAQIAHLPLEFWEAPAFLEGESGARPESPILLVFRHAAEHIDLYRVMLRGEGVTKAQGRIRATIASAASEFFALTAQTNQIALQPEIALDFFVNYFASSLMGVLTWWLETEMPYSPERMADMFQRMFIPGARAVVRLNAT